MSIPAQIGDWAALPFFQGDHAAVAARVDADRMRGKLVLPLGGATFRAFALTPPADVRVVILGQDPYPNPEHAQGLAFSAPAALRPLPASLRNIFKELESDLNIRRENADLSDWAMQGVLLANTALTVLAGAPGSHAKIGWRALIEQAVAHVAAHRRGVVFVLWGRHAQGFAPLITPHLSAQGHLIIESAHPSPLSARRGFFGSKPFSRINAHLERPIVWG